MRAMPVESLAPELAAFDARISEEIAEHLVARAARLETRADSDADLQRAARFMELAALIQRELGVTSVTEYPMRVARLPSLA
jgi:hypothetical protein